MTSRALSRLCSYSHPFKLIHHGSRTAISAKSWKTYLAAFRWTISVVLFVLKTVTTSAFMSSLW